MLDINEIHNIQKDMLNEFTSFLDKNNIKYFLDYGTLIGAARHKGFIPWDDDVDISMIRKEYNKFLNAVKKTKNFMINDHLLITAPELKNTTFTFCKLYNLDYKVQEKGFNIDDEYLWIDVFPYDKLSPSVKENYKNYKNIKFIKKLIDIKRLKIKQIKSFSRNKIVFIIKCLTKLLLSFVSINYLTKKVNKIASKYEAKNYKYAQNIINISDFFEGEKISDLNDLVEVEFEDKKYKTLKCYDKHLRLLYGDYMILPPINEREIHLEKIYKVDKD